MLLKSGAESNVLNSRGETPLYLACRPTGGAVNVHIVQTLLENGAVPNMSMPCEDSSPLSFYRSVMPPLSVAASCGNTELTTLLIKFGARLDQCDKLGRTALHFAIDSDDICFARHSKSPKNGTSTVEILLSAGADANVMDSTGASPLYLACKKGKTEVVKLLLSRGASPNSGTTDMHPIHTACRGQHYDSVKLLLEYKADVTVRDTNGKTALHRALEFTTRRSDNISDLSQLLLDKGADIDAESDDGETPFYVACSNGLTPVVAKMLECGAKVDGNSGKKLPLIAACTNKHTSVVQLLLTNGADPNAIEKGDVDRYRRTLSLHIATADGNSELVELLLKHGASIDVVDTKGNTALHHAIQQRSTLARYSGKVVASSNAKSVLDILLENKADVNVVNNSGETPIGESCFKRTARRCLKDAAVIRRKPEQGITASCRVSIAERGTCRLVVEARSRPKPSVDELLSQLKTQTAAVRRC